MQSSFDITLCFSTSSSVCVVGTLWTECCLPSWSFHEMTLYSKQYVKVLLLLYYYHPEIVLRWPCAVDMTLKSSCHCGHSEIVLRWPCAADMTWKYSCHYTFSPWGRPEATLCSRQEVRIQLPLRPPWDRLEMTLCGWQDEKSNYYYIYDPEVVPKTSY